MKNFEGLLTRYFNNKLMKIAGCLIELLVKKKEAFLFLNGPKNDSEYTMIF